MGVREKLNLGKTTSKNTIRKEKQGGEGGGRERELDLTLDHSYGG
jgi:hypothetical protein